LAQASGLKPDEFDKWLAGQSIYPEEFGGVAFNVQGADPNWKLCPGSRLQIPNTILAWWAGDGGVTGRWLESWGDDKQYLRNLGFKVVSLTDVPGTAFTAEFNTTALTRI
jgi:hypothetical protein